jgi:hypothetical protein
MFSSSPFKFLVRGDPDPPAAPAAPAAAPSVRPTADAPAAPSVRPTADAPAAPSVRPTAAAPSVRPAAAPAAPGLFQFLFRGDSTPAAAAPAAAPSVRPTASIPLPFVKSGTDLGNTPIQSAILEQFEKTSVVDFTDASKALDDYIYGNDFATATAGMASNQIEDYRVRCWYRFQDTLLVPAMNRMTSASGAPAMIQLSPMARNYTQGVHDKLSHLEFFATNLYTKDSQTPGTTQQFFRALNRTLLQPVQNAGPEILVNKLPYDNDKKIFNVWFFLFLSGLQKLIMSVPAMFTDPSNPQRSSVRLYRGMGIGEKLSQTLWQPPVLQVSTKQSLFATKRDVVADVPVHTINEYETRGFSSFSSTLDNACSFALNKDPTIFVYEPARGRVEMSDLNIVTDFPNENEFLMFPKKKMLVVSREVSVDFPGYNETCGVLNQANVPITWLGLMDAQIVDGDNGAPEYDIRKGIKVAHTTSGGRRKKRSINHVHKHKRLTRRRRRSRCNHNKTQKYRGRK